MAATLLILIPLVGGLLVWLLPLSRANTIALTSIALLAEGVFWLVGLLRSDTRRQLLGIPELRSPAQLWDGETPQLGASWEWFEEIGASYAVGFHGFQYWLTGMAILVFACAIAFGAWVGRERPRAYFGLMLFTLGAVVGVFAAQDLLLFYVAFEAMLIPLYILVGVWGGANRSKATLLFVLYTMAGSLLMLASVDRSRPHVGQFALGYLGENLFKRQRPHLPRLRCRVRRSRRLCSRSTAGCGSRTPRRRQRWRPCSPASSPKQRPSGSSGSALTAFLSSSTTFDEEQQLSLSATGHVIYVLAALTLLYGSLLAFRQPNIRSVVAYSSMAQMGLIAHGALSLGSFPVSPDGDIGAMFQSVNHGLVSAAMFLLAGVTIQRAGTDNLAELGGLAKGRPILATVVMVVGMILLAVPGAATFTGEFAILTSIFANGWGYAAVGGLAMVLAAMYGLRLISAILHVARGTAVGEDRPGDLGRRELAFVLPLVAALVLLSAWPALVTGNSLPNDEQEQTG